MITYKNIYISLITYPSFPNIFFKKFKYQFFYIKTLPRPPQQYFYFAFLMISLNRKSNKFEVVLGLFLIIFFTPSLILSFLVNDTLYYESSISVGVMDHITKSLNSPLLSDLEAIPADSPCSPGFETLTLGQFPGTTTLLGTRNLPPVDLTIWNGTKLCG